MKVDLLDIINIIMIFQLLIFTAFLFWNKSGQASNYIFGLHLFSQAAGIYNTLTSLQKDFFYYSNPDLALIGYPFVFLWGPTFYLYVKSIAFKDFKLKRIHLLHLVPAFLLLLFFCFTFYFFSTETKRLILQDKSYAFFSKRFIGDLALRIQILFYIISSFRILYVVRNNLKENFSSVTRTNLSWLYFVVIGYTICFIISVTSIYMEFYLKSYSRFLLLGNFLQFFIYFNIIFFRAWSQPEIFLRIEENVKYKKSKLTKDEAKEWINKLNDHLSASKSFLNPDLSLSQLAESINVHPKLLSQIINEYFSQNFFDYINRLRIEESKKLLLDTNCKKNVLEILYETGFNSKATFNRAFKKETGLSPTEFKKKFACEIVSQD